MTDGDEELFTKGKDAARRLYKLGSSYHIYNSSQERESDLFVFMAAQMAGYGKRIGDELHHEVRCRILLRTAGAVCVFAALLAIPLFVPGLRP